jgi:hypothetical protein
MGVVGREFDSATGDGWRCFAVPGKANSRKSPIVSGFPFAAMNARRGDRRCTRPTRSLAPITITVRPRLWRKGNVCGVWATPPRIMVFGSRDCLTTTPSCRNVDERLCVLSATHVAKTPRGSQMGSLSYAVNQRSMLRVSGEVLLAFCCATPLLLLLCFLV